MLDWSVPWLALWAGLGHQIDKKIAINPAAGCTHPELLNGFIDSSFQVQFVEQTELPEGEAYEAFIYRTRQVPTRDNLHDFFNGLCWLQFPHTKRRLNQLQFRQISQAGVGATRGPVRDAITVLDENGALLCAPDALWQALLAKDWQRLFVTERALWQQARLVLIGHALLEKLLQPRKNLVAHVYHLKMPKNQTTKTQTTSEFMVNWDALLAADLNASKLAGKPFAPLPVLGVPGWWAANEDPAFYEDAAVFRRQRG